MTEDLGSDLMKQLISSPCFQSVFYFYNIVPC